MRVIYHNWSATKQRPHPQSVAEISRHSVLSGDRIRQCETFSLKSSHKEQPSVIHLLWAKGLSTNAIQSEMHPVYGDKYYTRPAIHVWCKKFAHGQESVVDKEEPYRHVVSTTNAIRSS